MISLPGSSRAAQDLVLAGEVVVERGLGDAEALGDLPQRGAVVALLDEELGRHVEDALAGVSAHVPHTPRNST